MQKKQLHHKTMEEPMGTQLKTTIQYKTNPIIFEYFVVNHTSRIRVALWMGWGATRLDMKKYGNVHKIALPWYLCFKTSLC